ncbi:MAG TPA: DUF4129 domain-containing protein [Thermoplasmata archaeon]|nr:DUF4129 domain-containing protein [Thermoplasmata archaeon]
MPRWSSKASEPAPTVIERVEPVEIPVLTETKRRLQRGEYDEAIRFACLQVVADLERAFGRPFPPGWTLSEVVERGRTDAMGHLPEFLERLAALYGPLRFGAPSPRRDPDALLALLQSIYAAGPMWRLYLEMKWPDASPPIAAGASPAAGAVPPGRRVSG